MIGHYYCLSRILSIPCKVCGDFSSGKHYNIFACDGCAGFFKRSIRSNRQYICRAAEKGSCIIDKTHRNQCRACRLKKCQEAGMNKDAVQHERGSRKTTVKTQENSSNNFKSPRTNASPFSDEFRLGEEVPPKMLPSPKLEPNIAPPTGFFWNNAIAQARITQPPLMPLIVTPTDLCEAAAQLLFMNVQWVKSISSFTLLPLSDQLLLMEDSWRDLFVLGAAQFLPYMELSSFINACAVCDGIRSRTATILLEKVRDFHQVLTNFRHFHLDQFEFACLRAISFFKTSFSKRHPQLKRVLSDAAAISNIQDNMQLKLNKYISVVHPEEPLRFGKLLLLLPTLKNVLEETIEALFFRNTIGHVPIVSIITDMYKTYYQVQRV